MRDVFDLVLAVSDFNKQDLIDMGYRIPIKVLPILIPFDDYTNPPSQEILEKYDDDYANVVFVGRVSPHKCQHDVMRAFESYQRNYNKKSRLFIVGSYAHSSSYYQRLKDYAQKTDAANIIFTGHTAFSDVLAYYRCADLFLCQSEHEGFCVPLVEAMFFDVPIVAYDSSAISWTLGGSGFLCKNKNPLETAGAMNRILTDEMLRRTIIQNQRERLACFRYEKIKALFWNCMDEFMGTAG